MQIGPTLIRAFLFPLYFECPRGKRAEKNGPSAGSPLGLFFYKSAVKGYRGVLCRSIAIAIART
jgi:hypothetical protein